MNNIVKVVIAIILAIVLIVIGYLVIYPKYCDITIGISTPVGAGGQYIEGMVISCSYMPESKKAQSTKILDDFQEFRLDFFEKHKDDEYHIEIEITVEKGKTIVAYIGTITDNKTGVEEPFEKEFVYDFVLTKDIQE